MKWIGRLFLLALSVWLGGCQSEDNSRFSGKTGLLITLTDEADQAYSRMAPSELEDPLSTMFKLRVVDAATNKVAYSGKCEEFILLKEGTYNLTATYGENPVIALDAPYYVGTLEGQRVVTGQETAATVSCAVANALLSVNYNEESLKKAYEDYSVTVSVDDQSVEIDSTGEKSAYFQAGSSVKLVFHGHLAGTGKEVSYDIVDPEGGEFSNIPAKTHVKVTLGIAGEVASGVGISIEKLEVSTVSVTETLPMEFMPKPKVESTDFVNNELSFAETETKSAVINLNLSSPLQDLKLKFNSADAKFAGLEGGKEYQLSNADDKAAVETALGITLPEIGATEGSLDFSSLTPQLMTDAGNTVSSTIEVDVKANNRWASQDEAANRVYTLKCNKPIFHVSVYPGNIWTKEFTMNPLIAEEVETGDYEVLSKNIRYQFSTNENGDWSDLDSGLRKADLTPGTTYYVRGFYRDGIYSDVVAVTTYSPIQLENGEMEDWDYEITNDAREELIKNREYIYWKKWFPWSSVSSPSIWNTVNQTTTQDGNSPNVQWYPFVGTVSNPPYVGCCYVANSGTIPVEGAEAHIGKSALLKTVGWGSGNTGGGDASVINNVTPAELYLGTYDLKNHQPVYGIEYASRPTAIRFWCKYIPKSTDLLIAEMVILDSEGVEIGSATIPTEEAGATEWVEKELLIEYTDLKKAPAKMYILFKSGTITDTGVMDKPGFTNLSDGESVGSKLYIDDISLVYDK